MGRILIIYPHQGLLDILRGVLSGAHSLEMYRNPQAALRQFAEPQAYDSVLCGLQEPPHALEVFSRVIESSANARLIPIAQNQTQVEIFSALWNADPKRSERNDRLEKEWLADPCTMGEILALFSKSQEPIREELTEQSILEATPAIGEGTEIDGYRLMGLIGTGGFGKTWLACNRTTGRLVALKCVEGEEQLHQELAALRKYVHVAHKDEHLVKIEHINVVDSRLWLVTPLADSLTGGYTAASYRPLSLASYLETRGHMAEKTACRLAIELVQALSALHQAGLLHGDVSPANVLSVGSRWVLADPGLVRFLGEPGICRNRIYYPQPAPSRASDDLYAVGVILWDMTSGLWEMVSGKERLRLDAQMLRFISRKEIAIGKILTRAVAENPEQRFMVAGEMLQELNALAASQLEETAFQNSLYNHLQSLRTSFATNQKS